MGEAERQPAEPTRPARLRWAVLVMNLPPASFFLFWPVLGLIVFLVVVSLRRVEPRITCPANLKTVGFALAGYADKHAGELPPTLDTIVGCEGVTREMLRCPVAASRGPGAEYVYIPSRNWATAGSETILAYEDLGNHNGRGAHALFVDFHVKWLRPAELTAAIARANANLEATATRPTTTPD